MPSTKEGWLPKLRQLWSWILMLWELIPREEEMARTRKSATTSAPLPRYVEAQFVLLVGWVGESGFGTCNLQLPATDNMRLLVEKKDFRCVAMLLLASFEPRQGWGKHERSVFDYLMRSSDPALFHLLIDNHRWEVGFPSEDDEGFLLRQFPEVSRSDGTKYPPEWLAFTGPAAKEIGAIMSK